MSHETAQCPEVTALAALRSATSSLHAVLDSALPLARDGAGLHDYVDHLRHLRTWLATYLGAERALGSSIDPDTLERKQLLLARIDKDLAAAGYARPGEPGLPADAALPAEAAGAMKSAAYRWGVDYVVEGSQLGGSVLYRRLSEALAPHPLTYLRGDGADTGAHWRRFTGQLIAAVTTPEDIAAACRGAVDAFHRLATSFGMGLTPEREATSGQAA